MAAVVVVEGYLTARGKGVDMARIGAHVRAAETVDALLRIAHHAQTAVVRACEAADDGQLHGVGVLELVNHDQPEAVLVAPRNLGALQRGSRLEQQVVLVEHAVRQLHPIKDAHRVGGNREQHVLERPRQRKLQVEEKLRGDGAALALLFGARTAARAATLFTICRHSIKECFLNQLAHGLAPRDNLRKRARAHVG